MILATVVGTEFAKLRRVSVTWVTFVVYAAMIALLVFAMWIMGNPGMAASLGLIGAKANFVLGGQPLNAATYLTLVVEISGLGGMVILAFIVTYLFGREYAEGTAKNLLALPLPRYTFVVAKLVVAAVWTAALTLWLLVCAWLGGWLVGLPEFTADLFWPRAAQVVVTSGLMFSVCPLVAWVAVASRGYIAPLGFAFATLIVAQFLMHTGWGPYCPWSILMLYATSAPGLDAVSGVVLAATFVLGVGLIVHHEVFADNTQ